MLKVLNNIGIIGSILAGIADIVFVIIFIIGIKIEYNPSANIVFAVVNAVIGLMINTLLRYQGQKYAEIENEEICNKFYRKEIEKEKKHLSLTAYNAISIIKDILMKGVTTTFSIFGIIYLSIEGSKNPIQLLITIVNLILFACFGLISMNSSYCRYYNIQVPYMEKQIKKKEIKEDGTN